MRCFSFSGSTSFHADSSTAKLGSTGVLLSAGAK